MLPSPELETPAKLNLWTWAYSYPLSSPVWPASIPALPAAQPEHLGKPGHSLWEPNPGETPWHLLWTFVQLPEMPVKGREGSCWGFALPHLKIFWRSQFSSVLSCHKLSVKSLVINPSMHSACKTEDVLHRQQGAEMTAVSRLQQPSNLEPLPGCKQHRESRTIHHWVSDFFSKTTNMHPHLPFGFPSAVSPGEIFLKVTLSGTSVLDSEQSHMGTQPMWAHRSSEQPPTKAALFQF